MPLPSPGRPGGTDATLSPAIPTRPTPRTVEERYLDLLKRTLTRALVAKPHERQTISPGRAHLRALNALVRRVLSPMRLELVRVIPTQARDYIESGHAAMNRAEDAETMLGILQLDQMQACITDVLDRNVPGDLLEAGVWRGGMTIFMRAMLHARNDAKRRVWVVDSFAGLPRSAQDSYGWKPGEMAVALDDVKRNFARYGCLDDQVVFLEGFFSDTLPTAPISSLAVLRIDADLYESTRDVLACLYPRVSVGGYVVVDDYRNLVDCRRAVDEYRAAHAIVDEIVPIDTRAAYWLKTS